MKVGVLASGEGTNLQALLDTVHGNEVQVVGVASDQPSSRALQRAQGAGVATRVFLRSEFGERAARDAAIADWLAERGVELVVLAGYMAILDAAIVDVVTGAEPSVGRTRTVEILRGGRSQVVRKNAYDGLPAYGTFDHLTSGEVLARVDELITAGRLRSTGGAFPKLQIVAAEQPVLG